MLNMVLKDMSNKTGYKVVPASQIKYNRRRRKKLAWRRERHVQSHRIVASDPMNDRLEHEYVFQNKVIIMKTSNNQSMFTCSCYS